MRGFDEYGFDRTVFTIVVLTSVPRDGSVNFSCAVSDFSPIDEQGKKVPVYPHRLVFLSPPQASEHTPPLIRRWLDFITDSLDGKMEESSYTDAMFREIAEAMRQHTVDPTVLAEIKDEAAWEKAKERFTSEGVELGRQDGLKEWLAQGIEKGALAQQRKTVLQAHQMGIKPAEITVLVGLSEAEVQEIIAGSEK